MWLALAVVFCAVLYFVDKNSQWRAFLKFARLTAALVVLAAASRFGYSQYEQWQLRKQWKPVTLDLSTTKPIDLSAGMVPLHQGQYTTADIDPPLPLGYTLDPCWTAPDAKTGVQFDQNSYKTLDGKAMRLPPGAKLECYPRVTITPDAPAKK